MRIFVAIDLDPTLKRKLEDLARTLKRTGADVRWADGRGMHLTLKFLGEVGPEAVPAVVEALRKTVSVQARFRLALRGTGTFPEGRAPRVLWVGVEEAPPLMGLQKAVESALESQGFPAEARPFHPHLTLGRVKGPARVADAVAELGRHAADAFGDMEAAKLTLFESVLRPQGADYRVVAEFELR
jgi:2'-5' RNA ligase